MKTIISIVIPCYGSEQTITTVVDSINTTFQNLVEYDYELVLVNDYSPDKTLTTIKRCAKNNMKIKVISFSKNFGQHAAVMAGLRHTKGDIIVCMDDDGQTPPEEMMKLINKVEEGYDVAYADYSNKKHSIFRNLGSAFNDKMANMLIGKPKDIYISSYFAMSSYIVMEMIKYDNPYPYLGGLVLRVTNNITNVNIEHKDRIVGESTYTFAKLIMLWLNGFTAFSVKPLRMASFVGSLISIVGLIYSIYVIIRKLITPAISVGWSSLISVNLIMGGLTLLMLGLLGEYIGRMYISLNKSPQFVIKETVNFDDEDN